MEKWKLVIWLGLIWVTLGTNIGVAQTERSQSEEYRELQGELAELHKALKTSELERERLQSELEDVEKQMQLVKELDEADRELARANIREERVAKLHQRVERLEQRIEIRDEIRSLRSLHYDLLEIEHLFHTTHHNEIRNKDPSQVDLSMLDDSRQAVRKGIEKLVAIDRGLERNLSPKYLESRFQEFERLEQAIDIGHESVEELFPLLEQLQEESFENGEKAWDEILDLLKRDERGEYLKSSPSVIRNPPSTATPPIVVSENSLAKFQGTDFETELVPLLRTYCFDCHGDESSAGSLNLQAMIQQQPLVANRRQWINVIEQSKNHVMPPQESEQPDEAERTKIVLGLHNQIHNFDYSQIHDPGFEMTRRLTHREYDNTVSDLFGVELKVAGRFPKELSGKSGFDNSSNTLFVQPLLMERYFFAADEIVEDLFPSQVVSKRHEVAKSRLFFVTPATQADENKIATQILVRFVGRAFRRPLTDVERKRLSDQYAALKADGLDHETAIKSIVRQTLVSPNFLMKFERTHKASGDFRIDNWELASRLSYFLWASMPDDELFQLASRAKLSDPAVLSAQVDRMLLNKRSYSLGEVFAAQWLGSQHIGTRVRLDPIDNPWCTDSLMSSMRKETAMFVHNLIVQDEKIERLVDADFTFLNEELANHYGILGVEGPKMRRVQLSNTARGGLLGQASILAVTSFPYRTSPVVRGKWILETLLGTPPPPPPPNVSQFSEEVEENESLTIREKLARHRASPSCNACHREMDPLGLSLEKFDWFGRYRKRYGRARIDATGELPDGSQFDGISGLKSIIVKKRLDDLQRQVASKLLSYALGRQLEYYDEPALRKILATNQDSRFHTLVHSIVVSYPFQTKRVRTSESESISEVRGSATGAKNE